MTACRLGQPALSCVQLRRGTGRPGWQQLSCRAACSGASAHRRLVMPQVQTAGSMASGSRWQQAADRAGDRLHAVHFEIRLFVGTVHLLPPPCAPAGLQALTSVWCGAADIISAVEFDQTGQHLATGDRGGRVVLFERLSAPQVAPWQHAAAAAYMPPCCTTGPQVSCTIPIALLRGLPALDSLAVLAAQAVSGGRPFGTQQGSAAAEPCCCLLQRSTPIDQRAPPLPLSSFEYRYLTEFQSHEPEFDYLKSLEIEEKINRLRWLNHASSARMVLSTNDKTIKLWKVQYTAPSKLL